MKRLIAISAGFAYVILMGAGLFMEGTDLKSITLRFGIENASFLHLPAFFAFCMFASVILRLLKVPHHLLYSGTASIVISFLTEILQNPIPGRGASLDDLFYNTAGIIIYIMIENILENTSIIRSAH